MAAPVEKNQGIAALVIGVLEILFGILIMACSFAVGAKISGQSSVSPFWAGIPYLIPGILGIIAGITKNFWTMVAFMALNIICFIIDGVAAILLFLAIGIWQAIVNELTEKCRSYNTFGKKTCVCQIDGTNRTFEVEDCDTLKSIVGLLWAIIISAVMAALTSLAGSILGCIATCCRSAPAQQTVIVRQPGIIMQSQVQQQHYAAPGAATTTCMWDGKAMNSPY